MSTKSSIKSEIANKDKFKLKFSNSLNIQNQESTNENVI